MRQRNDPIKDTDDTTWFRAVNAAMGIGLFGILAYSWAEHSWKVFACSVLVGLAAGLVGALLGFVFGVPKTVASSSRATAAGTVQYQGNTNLEEISDWLTKILVGAGLVELKQIPGALDTFGSKFVSNQSLGAFGWVAGPALVIAYSVCGFLLAYLWARIYMITDLSPELVRGAAEAANDAATAAANALAATKSSAAAAAAANVAADASTGAAANAAATARDAASASTPGSMDTATEAANSAEDIAKLAAAATAAAAVTATAASSAAATASDASTETAVMASTAAAGGASAENASAATPPTPEPPATT